MKPCQKLKNPLGGVLYHMVWYGTVCTGWYVLGVGISDARHPSIDGAKGYCNIDANTFGVRHLGCRYVRFSRSIVEHGRKCKMT